MKARNPDLEKFEDDTLVTELEVRGWSVYEYELDAEDFPCEICANRPEMADETLEAIHYLLAAKMNDEAIKKMKDLIYDQIGRIS